MWHAQQDFRILARRDQPKLEGLSPQMHVRIECDDTRVVLNGQLRVHRVIRVAGSNGESAVSDLQSENALARRLLREHDSQARPISGGLAVGGVVHLENQVASSF